MGAARGAVGAFQTRDVEIRQLRPAIGVRGGDEDFRLHEDRQVGAFHTNGLAAGSADDEGLEGFPLDSFSDASGDHNA